MSATEIERKSLVNTLKFIADSESLVIVKYDLMRITVCMHVYVYI